jgi:hypothetical protein
MWDGRVLNDAVWARGGVGQLGSRRYGHAAYTVVRSSSYDLMVRVDVHAWRQARDYCLKQELLK